MQCNYQYLKMLIILTINNIIVQYLFISTMRSSSISRGMTLPFDPHLYLFVARSILTHLLEIIRFERLVVFMVVALQMVLNFSVDS